jgi:hypothetical protein
VPQSEPNPHEEKNSLESIILGNKIYSNGDLVMANNDVLNPIVGVTENGQEKGENLYVLDCSRMSQLTLKPLNRKSSIQNLVASINEQGDENNTK